MKTRVSDALSCAEHESGWGAGRVRLLTRLQGDSLTFHPPKQAPEQCLGRE
jgi:hypothetical protein